MAIVFLSLLAAALLAFIWYKQKTGHHSIPKITWEVNTLHETDESENEVNISERMIPTNKLEENEVQCADGSSIDNNSLELSELPKWLRERPDMIYPQLCVEKGQQLGHGQYGNVFKGKLVLGKAVYVNSMLN